MSKPFPLTIGGKAYEALPPSFAYQKKNKERMQRLQAGDMNPVESQDFMAEYVTHCIKRATPDLNVEALENDLDAISIAQASAEIGIQVQKQVAAAYGVANLGEATAG